MFGLPQPDYGIMPNLEQILALNDTVCACESLTQNI